MRFLEGTAKTGGDADDFKYYENGELKRAPHDDLCVVLKNHNGERISTERYYDENDPINAGPDYLFWHREAVYTVNAPSFITCSYDYFFKSSVTGLRGSTPSMRSDNIHLKYCGCQVPVMDYDYDRDVRHSYGAIGESRVLEDRELYNDYTQHIYYSPSGSNNLVQELANRSFKLAKCKDLEEYSGTNQGRLFVKFLEDGLGCSLTYSTGTGNATGGGTGSSRANQPVCVGVFPIGTRVTIRVRVSWEDLSVCPFEEIQAVVSEDKICYYVGYRGAHRSYEQYENGE